jgi:hypothetical protein
VKVAASLWRKLDAFEFSSYKTSNSGSLYCEEDIVRDQGGEFLPLTLPQNSYVTNSQRKRKHERESY